MVNIGGGELAILCLILFVLIVPVVALAAVLVLVSKKRGGARK